MKKPTGSEVKKLSFQDKPPRSAVSKAVAALKKTSKSGEPVNKEDEAVIKQLGKSLSGAQRAVFRKMLTSTAPPLKKVVQKSRK
jgi:hypothetical protein